MRAAFPESYYVACQEVFRRSTNQNDLMLKEMQAICDGRRGLSFLSVGSGVGLFEVPMLRMLIDQGQEISGFDGLDISAYACSVLEARLRAEFGADLRYRVVHQAFQEFSSENSFDIVLFNHVFEYLGGHALTWIRTSQALLAKGGNIIIFSPDRGGINEIYAQVMKELEGSAPFFSDDLRRMLVHEGLAFATRELEAACDISLLLNSDDDPRKMELLSFLVQRDCRPLPPEVREDYIAYYLSLRQPGGDAIPHPTTLFVL